MVLARRPKSQQAKGNDKRYRESIRSAARLKMTGQRIGHSAPLYSRILWIRRHDVDIDVDNIVKPILDALEGIVFADDASFAKCLVTRIDAERGYELVDAGAPAESYRELIDLLTKKVGDILYIEIGRNESQRVVFGTIDGGVS